MDEVGGEEGETIQEAEVDRTQEGLVWRGKQYLVHELDSIL